MALFSSPLPSSHLPTFSTTFSSKPHVCQRSYFPLLSKKNLIFISIKAAGDGEGIVVEEKKEEVSPTVTEVKVEKTEVKVEKDVASIGSNGVAPAVSFKEETPKFENPKWVGGTWDLKQFEKDGKPDWDAVIDAEFTGQGIVSISETTAIGFPFLIREMIENFFLIVPLLKVRRRKWLEDNPESSNNDEPVVFDTSIIPWWSWVKRFHLPEAELLNGRAAMVGFFMAYLVDSLTGVGLVDQMGNFFCKTLLLGAVLGVLFIRKNEDVENLKKLFQETTLYDKQWQATWKEETTNDVKKG